MRRVLGPRVEHEGRVSDIVEERVEAFVEERQPVLEADRPAALADRGVKIVVARRRAEFLGVSLAEAADRLRRQPRFAHRHEIERAQLPGRALRLRIESADGFERIAEEIEPDRRRGARRIEVENAAARRIIADVAHRARAGVAVSLEPARQIVHLDAVARRGRKSGRGDELERRDALRQRADRADQNARPLDRALGAREPRQHGHPLGGNRRVGRDAVVGLAVPGRQMQRLDLGRGEAERVNQALGAKTVAGEKDEGHGALLAGLGERARQLGDDKRIVALGGARQRDDAALREPANGGSKQAHGDFSALISALFGASREEPRRRARRAMSKLRRRRLSADDPGERLWIGGVEQKLERVELALAHRRQMRIREPAHDEVHFA